MATRITGLGEINYFLSAETEPKSLMAQCTTGLGDINCFQRAK